MSKHVIRGPAPEDFNFIMATWNKGLYYGTNWINKNLEQDEFFAHYNDIARGILLRPSVVINVCCLADDYDVILGYSVLEGQCLHWVFVKESWRKMGIGKSLVPSTIKIVSNITDVGMKIKPKHWKINPFLNFIGGASGREEAG